MVSGENSSGSDIFFLVRAGHRCPGVAPGGLLLLGTIYAPDCGGKALMG